MNVIRTTLALGAIAAALAGAGSAAAGSPPAPGTPGATTSGQPSPPPSRPCTVPALRGLTVARAARVLGRAGCTAIGREAPSARVPKGRVAAQSIAPGSTVDRRTRIVLTISTGPRA